MTAPVASTGISAARLAPGFQLGEYRIGQPLWPLRIADAYRAEGPKGAATVYVVHARIAQSAPVRDAIIAGTRAAAALPEHKHVVHTIAAGLTGDILWIATEEVEGSLVRELLSKKRLAGAAGLGARAAGNLITGVCAALADANHGALSDESVIVSRTGRVRVIDLALGRGTLAAIQAGLVPPSSALAPEATGAAPPPRVTDPLGAASSAPPSAPADVYGIGALLYEALVGKPLERGGPRPSEVVQGLSSQIDEVVARACHRDPEKRFGRAEVLGEVVAEALSKGGAMMQTAAIPLISGPSLDQQVSLAQSLSGELPVAALAAATATAVDGAAPIPAIAAAVAGNPAIDRALSAALADTTEKWLVSKGKYDYGPFSLADVLAQIEKGDIVSGAVIMDKDSGARSDVATHPLLGPMVEVARQRRDDARRAQAEVKAQSTQKKRGALLYAVIGLGVVGAAVAVYLIINSTRDAESGKVAGLSSLDKASLNVKVSEPKPPPRPQHKAGGSAHHGGGGQNYQNTGENLALDLSDESDDGAEQLDMHTVYGVYSKHGGELGGCMQSSGERQASIGIIINGPSGRVTWVKVNGQQAGALYGCLSRVLRGMQFPSIHGPRTRAEFDIAM